MCRVLWAGPLTGIVSKPQTTDQGTFGGMALYVANSVPGTISQYRIGIGGDLHPMSPPTVPAGGGGVFRLISDPSRRFAYGLDVTGNALFQYRIAPDGHLIPLSPPRLPVGKGDEGIVYLTPNGRFAYCPNIGDNTLSQFAVQTDGTLRPLSPPTVATGRGPISLLATPNCRFLYCANTSDGSIFSYRIQVDGRLSPLGSPTLTHAEPVSLTFLPGFQVLYCRNWNPGSISQFHVEADGRLAELAPALSLFSDVTGDLVAVPMTRSVYATDGSQTLFQYHINANGGLSPLSPAKMDLPGGIATHIALSNVGGAAAGTERNIFLYTNLQFSKKISQYRITQDGTLSALSPEVADDLDGSPQSLAVDPTGRFVYVVNDQTSTISQYRIARDGQLTPLSPSAVATGGGSTFITIVTLPASAPHKSEREDNKVRAGHKSPTPFRRRRRFHSSEASRGAVAAQDDGLGAGILVASLSRRVPRPTPRRPGPCR